jgi:hypothetical protein
MIENPNEEVHSKSMIQKNENLVINKKNQEKPIRLEYGNNLQKYINHDAGLKTKDELISN